MTLFKECATKLGILSVWRD